MILRADDNVITGIIIAGIIIFITVAMIIGAKSRAKLAAEGKIIQRSKGFWEYAEIFSLKTVTLLAVFNRFKTLMPDKVLAYEYQPENNRIVFIHRGYDESFKASLKLVSSVDDVNTYNLTVHEWTSKGNSGPSETALNILYTAVEKTFLGFDPNIKVKTEYVERTTKRSFF